MPRVTVVSDGSGRTVPLSNPNRQGAPLVFLVIGRASSWWRVRVPMRPNGTTGWVSAGEVTVEPVDYALHASLARHRLTLYRLGRPVRSFRIGIGRPDAPTPTGNFFLTELLQPPSRSGPFGPFAYGLSAYSDTYSEFDGGPGQIGMHGTDDTSSIGRNVSHGCIRLSAHDIVALARVVPPGTPITITR